MKGIYEIIGALKILRKKKIFLKTLILMCEILITKIDHRFLPNELNLWMKENLIIWKPKVENVVPYLQKSKISILPSYQREVYLKVYDRMQLVVNYQQFQLVRSSAVEVCKNNFNGFVVPRRIKESLFQFN